MKRQVLSTSLFLPRNLFIFTNSANKSLKNIHITYGGEGGNDFQKRGWGKKIFQENKPSTQLPENRDDVQIVFIDSRYGIDLVDMKTVCLLSSTSCENVLFKSTNLILIIFFFFFGKILNVDEKHVIVISEA